jgi:hypothetical protein
LWTVVAAADPVDVLNDISNASTHIDTRLARHFIAAVVG